MNKAFDKLPALIQEELDASNALHPGFHSAHEGYAVLLEEVEEAETEKQDMHLAMLSIWRGIKHDNMSVVENMAGVVYDKAVCLAAEAIQVAAMAQKFIDSKKAGWSA